MTPVASTLAPIPLRRTVLALALLAAFGGATAQQLDAARADEVRRDLYSLDNRIAFGIAGVSDDNRRFGQHRGLTRSGVHGLLDLDLVRRDEVTGTWLRLSGRNLGLDTREARFVHERQGDWSYSIAGSRFDRREPLIVNTALAGIGTPNQVVSATAPRRDVDLGLARDVLTLGARKFLLGNLDVVVSFQQDESRGDRMFGRGVTNVHEFVTEPVDRITRQWSVVASYAGKRWQLSGGYSGSSYDNQMPVLRTTGGNGAANAFGPAWVIALPPGNQAHQLHLSGGLNLADHGRASFKLSHQIATQNERFDPVFVRLAGSPESLDGKVATTLAYADLVLRPTRRLDLLASVRWEDRDDRTPEQRFLPDTPATVGSGFFTAGTTGIYKPRSFRQGKGAVEAGWTFDGGWRLLGSVDHEQIDRSVSEKYRRVSMRRSNDETTARVELKRTASDVFNAGMAVLRSERGGSDYVDDTFDPNALTHQVGAITWADRSRERVRVSADWVPAEAWSVQFMADASRDEYGGRNLGPKQGDAQFVSVDGQWRLSDKWTATAWLSQERTRAQQQHRSDRVGNVALGYDTLWAADLMVTTRAAGLALKGRLSGRLEAGVDLGGSNDIVKNVQAKIGGAGTLPVSSLPEMFYRTRTAKLFADYAIDRMSGVRVDLVADRKRTNDWTWVNWVYNGAPAIAAAARNSDGSTVLQLPRENVTVIGIVYHLRWR